MANTSWNLNTDRILSQIGPGVWGDSEPTLIVGTISQPDFFFRWNQGNMYNDYYVRIGSSQGSADITTSGWLGDVDRYQAIGLPETSIWVRLFYRLGRDDFKYIDANYRSVSPNVWNDDENWSDDTRWSD